MLDESGGEGGSPHPRWGRGLGTSGGDGGAVWHNPGSALGAGLGLGPACKEPEGQGPGVRPSNKGGNEDGEGHCSKRP